MKQNVRKELMNEWIAKNRPDGIRKLAEATAIPTSSLQKIRAGREVLNPLMRKSLAEVLGAKESELFPAPTGKSRAS